ncbi:hypothetical protein [Dokdonella sp.]|uniref:hypothetical protein n=1 Tax=Dokdonella sp. TaxID=2291710 RepID=UPI001B0292F8|nr:hypothetical protein [Dokdonella sp.]MBO9664520.1 hypothetical protein [Dokdonella sp.]
MSIDIQRADAGLRRTTFIVLTAAAIAAVWGVFAFHQWMLHQSAALSTEQLIVRLRLWIGLATTASGLCLLLLAGHSARTARRVAEQRRWPLAGARVLRDTPIRRGDAALRLGRLLNGIAVVLLLLALGVGLLSWRLFALAA